MTDEFNETLEERVGQMCNHADDAELAELAGDAGKLGTIAREKLTDRGHQVLYSDVNGVQNANVTLKENLDAEGPRGDSANLLEGSHQTLGQQAEGVTDIDPTRVMGEQESGAGVFARQVDENDRTDRGIPAGPAVSIAAREDGDEAGEAAGIETGPIGEDADEDKAEDDEDDKGTEKRSTGLFRR